MREEALAHLGHVASLADIESRLRTWLLLSGLSDGRLIRLRDAHQADGSSPCSAEGEAGGTPHVLPLRRRIGLGQS